MCLPMKRPNASVSTKYFSRQIKKNTVAPLYCLYEFYFLTRLKKLMKCTIHIISECSDLSYSLAEYQAKCLANSSIILAISRTCLVSNFSTKRSRKNWKTNNNQNKKIFAIALQNRMMEMICRCSTWLYLSYTI